MKRSRTEVLLNQVLNEIHNVQYELEKKAKIGKDKIQYTIDGRMRDGAFRSDDPNGYVSLELTMDEEKYILDLLEKHYEELGYKIKNYKTYLEIEVK